MKSARFCRLLALFFCFQPAWFVGFAAESSAAAPSNPSEYLNGVEEIVFCTRLPYDDPHWYANIGYYCQDENRKAYSGNGKPDESKLLKLNVRTGALTVLLDAAGGTLRDPQVHYDGDRLLFSYRKAGSDFFHLYEIQTDGTNLRQITDGPFDDYEPTYLPDGDLCFVSTRCKRWVNCWMTMVGVLHRCDREGKEIRAISANTEHDNTPWMLPDGRVLYTRWEYVDRSQVEFHHLWAMNPDGSGQTVYYGNMHPNILMIDAKPIPGSDEVLANFSPGHGVNEHAGIATVVSPEAGPDHLGSARRLHKGRLIRDPYPLSAEAFLAARDRQIVLMAGNGLEKVLFTHTGAGGLHEPRPIVSRMRETIIPDRTNPKMTHGRMLLADVYEGRQMEGVKRGEIKKLLVLESLPKPVNFSGGPDLTSWLGTFTLERVLGTVPVEKDGSAFFEVPANRQIFFVALDDRDLSVKRMQSFTCAMPGETVSCVGCHEARNKAPVVPERRLLASHRPPSRIQPFAGYPDVLDFQRDIQPILDARCVECHQYSRRDGGVLLTGDLGPAWSHSYFSLLAFRQVADGANGLGNQPPRALGSSASPLLQKFNGSHYDVKASEKEWRTLWLWIESGAPFAGSYAALRNEPDQISSGRALELVFAGQHAVLRRRCAECHDVSPQNNERRPLPFNWEARRNQRGIVQRPTAAYERVIIPNDPVSRYSSQLLLNFTRPELSPLLLAPLPKEKGGYGSCPNVFADMNDPDAKALLAAIQSGKKLLEEKPRYGSAQFKPNPQYIREMKRFGILSAAFDASQESLDVFQIDQKYWRSLWAQRSEE